MKIHEVTHHGNFREEREHELPADFTTGDVQAMLAGSAYSYTNTVPKHLHRIREELMTTGKSYQGWTNYEVVPAPVTYLFSGTQYLPCPVYAGMTYEDTYGFCSCGGNHRRSTL